MRLACFISPHGFGHAARSSAILRQCCQQRPDLRFDLFTRVPHWFFEESIPGVFDYHETLSDVGFIQRSALDIDLPATIAALDDFLPFDPAAVRSLADAVLRSGCSAVLCDISPLGIAVAEAAGLPSVLVENFTWDWLYEPYRERYPAFRAHCSVLRQWFDRAVFHVQTTPVCVAAEADLVSTPVSRLIRRSREAMRAELGLRDGDRLVVITLGGVPQPLAFLPRLRQRADITFLISGWFEDRRDDNLILIDQRTRIYMPDLIHCSDAVVAKLGYGTVAEVWTAGRSMAYVARDFRESASLKAFVDREIPSFEIGEATFHRGDWIDRVDELLALPHPTRSGGTGAAQVAGFVLELLQRSPAG
jgi:hypothetical protein